ncbi:molybdopterin-dependent oxidoreductase, partial [Armatimonas sp.]|uniref:molybdopterin-dependent oxidoreductase n=1 Tax=Armatimonas sp. TaxID=1872638 RepID=UPI0037503F80
MNLPPNQKLAAPGKWPVVGEKAPRAGDLSPWNVTVHGLVTEQRVFGLDELLNLPQVTQAHDIHCVTRWSKLGVAFTGLLLTDLLALCGGPLSEAKYISFIARSDREHSTSLVLSEALGLGCLVAFTADGAPLEEIHGGPVRVVTPGRYFYKSVKWLERIELLREDRWGYWEDEIGYHNNADPWREERYITSSVNPKILERALASRNFSGLDLRGVDLRGRDLTGLKAADAKLRDAHFEGANLTRADFTRANLSNAHLENANCTRTKFTDADLEGAAFENADLTDADLTGASLFGT